MDAVIAVMKSGTKEYLYLDFIHDNTKYAQNHQKIKMLFYSISIKLSCGHLTVDNESVDCQLYKNMVVCNGPKKVGWH